MTLSKTLYKTLRLFFETIIIRIVDVNTLSRHRTSVTLCVTCLAFNRVDRLTFNRVCLYVSLVSRANVCIDSRSNATDIKVFIGTHGFNDM